MVRDGIPFVAVPAVIAVIFGVLHLWPLMIAFGLIAGFMLFFFRDPHREVPQGEGLIVSAADGRVTRIETNDTGKLVSVFLSPLDVHVNRSPVTGTIDSISYIKGKKMPATKDAASLANERNSLIISGPD